MKTLRRILLWAVVALVVLALVATAIGFTFEEDHVVAREAVYTQSPKRIWSVINRFDLAADWRSDVDAVVIESNDPIRFIEMQSTGPLPMEVVEQEAPEKLVVMIADPDLPFSGTWTFELSPVDNGTRLTITERGAVSNPLMRFMARTFMDPNATADTYLVDLGLYLGDNVTPAAKEG